MEDASRFGRISYSLDQKLFHIVETRVPTSFLDQLYHGTADRMTYIAVDHEQLAALNRVGSISIRNSVPWLAKP